MKYSEPKLNLDAEDTEGFKDVDVMLFDKVIAFDNLRHNIVVIANARMENIEEEHKRCCAELDEIEQLIRPRHADTDRTGQDYFRISFLILGEGILRHG